MTEQLHTADIYEALALLLLMIIAGIRAGTRNEEAFLIGGRAVSAGPLAGTIAAGVIGGGVLLVFSEYAFRYGFSAFFIIGGIVVGTLLMIPVAMKFKPMADEQLFYSLPDLYSYLWSRPAGLLATFIVAVWTIGFIIMQLISAGEVLAFMTGWPYWVGVIISALTVASYLLASGFEAVVITDIIQYVALVVLLITVFPAAMLKMDLSRMFTISVKDHMAFGDAAGFFVLGALNMIVSADMWQRFYAAKNISEARRGLKYSAVLVLIAGLLLLAPVFYARTVLTDVAANRALTYSLTLLLPRWLLGFGLVGVLSTIIATLDTMVFILGISIGHDIRVQQMNKPVIDRVRVTRTAIVVALTLGSAVSVLFRSLLTVGLALSTFGLILAPSILSRVVTTRIPARAVECGLVCGLVSAVGLIVGNIFKPGLLSPENTLFALLTAIVGTTLGALPALRSSR